MADEAYGVDIRARLQGGQEVRSEAQGIAGAFRRVGSEVRTSGEQSTRAGHSYEYATQRLHLFGNAAVGMRERTLGLASAALGVTGAMFGLEEVVRKSSEAWSEQRRTTAQTGAVLRSTGGAAHVTAGEVQSLAESISRTTGLQADQIQQAENMTLSFRNIRDAAGRGNDIFTQTTRAAVDMSAAFTSAGKSMSISDAALQLGKALNDPEKGMTRLQRIGVVFTQGQIDQAKALQESGDRMGAQRIILRELTKEFGGSAAAVATPGAKLRATVHQLEEQFGRGLQPAIDKVDQGLIHLADRAMPRVSRFSDDLTKAFSAKGLDLGQRLSLVGQAAHTDLGPFVHQLGTDLRNAHLDDELANVIDWAGPRIANAAAQTAPKAAGAFLHAWWHADAWGKLLTAGFLLNRMGAFGIAGRYAATRFTTNFERKAIDRQALSAMGGRMGTLVGAGVAAGVLVELPNLYDEIGKALGLGSDWHHEAKRGYRDLIPGKEESTGGRRRSDGTYSEDIPLRLRSGGGRSAAYYNRHPGALTQGELFALAGNGRAVVQHHHIYIDGREVAGVMVDNHGKVLARGVTKHANDARARKSG